MTTRRRQPSAALVRGLSFVAVGVGACGGPSPPSPPPSTGLAEHGERVSPPSFIEGCFVSEGAPDPMACTLDGDCVVGGLFQPDSCCMSGVSHPHGRGYHNWQTAWFRSHCDGSCMQPPSPPLDCELAVRCNAGRCGNACGEIPSPSDGDLDAMDRSELETACEAGSTAACDRLGH